MKTDPNLESRALIDIAHCRSTGGYAKLCLSCGTCSAGCPITGVSGFDPRKIISMVCTDRDLELIDSDWPWICTLCGRCEYACPMGINIINIIFASRSLVDRNSVPKQIQKGLELGLKTGNNLGLPRDDFVFIIEDVASEMANKHGLTDFTLPIDKKGSNLLHTIHNKLINNQNEDLVHWWKIFYHAGESWTIPSLNWEGVNWGFFSADEDAMKVFVGRIVQHMSNLELSSLMYPE